MLAVSQKASSSLMKSRMEATTMFCRDRSERCRRDVSTHHGLTVSYGLVPPAVPRQDPSQGLEALLSLIEGVFRKTPREVLCVTRQHAS